ncbi:Ig-like domain-containing protein [Sandaracinus amylolyticus]|uniref:Outer membrane protein n=1 Tax=Sandaracinus amylolyticus TaxID=927083 RepID=A0A0F6W738_9BACT|nr:Ig-like domain-containing protein [Sandaracinus amylolyticus]AKF09111.1 outer membrane protein [Sandaracinus amylolyticus]
MTNSTIRRALLALVLALAGCERDDTVIPPADAHVPTVDGGTDAAAPDRTAPTIVDTDPDEGSVDVARDRAVTITFSEPMRMGTWSARAEGELVVGADASVDGETLTIDAPDGWPAASEIEIRLDDDWRDGAGNLVARPFVLRFTTADDDGPAVVESSPAEGASDVSVRAGALQIRFSEPMDQGAGTVRLEGGPGSLDATAPSWSATAVTYPLVDLAHDTSYRVVLEGFRDLAGNALDATTLGGDAVLDFTTGPDDEAPRAIASRPVEGHVDVGVLELGGTLEVSFDEDMDTAITSVPIHVGTDAPVDVDVSWPDARRAEIAVAGRLRLDRAIRVDLRGLRDVAGNALAPEPYLVDGELDFLTGTDAFVPFVVASTPLEAATGVTNPVGEVRLAFSETMDESTAEVTVRDNVGGTFTVTGTWTGAGTTLIVPFEFRAGRTYEVDARALRDRTGTPLSDAHAYLGDGVLDFTTATPTGASCADPLQLEHGTTDPATGRTTFLLRGNLRTRNNGSQSCDVEGHGGQDAVVQYTKTTPDLSDASGNGRALRITATTATNNVDLEVFRGVCDPRDPAAASAMVRCAMDQRTWDVVLDVPAGDYFLWVANTASRGDITITVEEVATLRDGETCETAWDTTSAIYTAPTAPGAPHVWDVPASLGSSVDVDDANGPDDGLACVETERDDVVLSFTKSEADTVLDVSVTASTFTIASELVFGGCRPDAPGATRGACVSGAGTGGRRFTARGPAGPVHVWLSSGLSGRTFSGARVEIREIPASVAPGSSCATAIPIAPGTSVPVMPDHAARYDAPSCFTPAANVTWYAFDSTEQLTHVRADLGGAIALVDAASGRTIGCADDASVRPLFHFAPIGSRVCVAIESGALIRSLAVEPIDYDGAGAQPAARVPIDPPSLAGTVFDDYDRETWLAATPTRLYQNMGLLAVIDAPAAGGPSHLEGGLDVHAAGRAAVTVGEALFAVTQASLSSSQRVFRYTDPSGAWAPEVWDLGAPSGTYTGFINALTSDGTSLIAVEERLTSGTTVRNARVFQLSTTTAGPPAALGQIQDGYNVTGVAADAQFLYFFGRAPGASRPDLYRLARADLAGGTPVLPTRIYTFPASTGPSSSAAAEMALDDLTSPRYLYLSGDAGSIHVIENPAGESPRYLGAIWRGESGDGAWDLQRSTGDIFVFSTSLERQGAWYRLER